MPTAIDWDLTEVLQRVTITEDGCWRWYKTQRDGYALVHRLGKIQMAHRFVYELLVGPIADGLDLDHRCHTDDTSCVGGPTCKHRACVNPEHMEPVEPLENHHRGLAFKTNTGKTHCPQGHPYSGWNLIRKYGRRYCRACTYARRAASRSAS